MNPYDEYVENAKSAYRKIDADPPLTEEEISYLANYEVSAQIHEDGSDYGPWLKNFLIHREMRPRLISDDEYRETERRIERAMKKL